jgi:hypothetical protein
MVNDVILTTNEGNSQKSGKSVEAANKIKVEGYYNSLINKPMFTSPFYVKIPKLGDEICMIQIHFVKQYDISAQGLSPKHVKVPKDIAKKYIFKLFEPLANKNGYNYVHTDDPKFIEKMESLWMIIHQKPYVPTSRLISMGMAKGLACEKMGKLMN